MKEKNKIANEEPLRYPLRIEKSRIAGLGAFAQQSIPPRKKLGNMKKCFPFPVKVEIKMNAGVAGSGNPKAEGAVDDDL